MLSVLVDLVPAWARAHVTWSRHRERLVCQVTPVTPPFANSSRGFHKWVQQVVFPEYILSREVVGGFIDLYVPLQACGVRRAKRHVKGRIVLATGIRSA